MLVSIKTMGNTSFCFQRKVMVNVRARFSRSKKHRVPSEECYVPCQVWLSVTERIWQLLLKTLPSM